MAEPTERSVAAPTFPQEDIILLKVPKTSMVTVLCSERKESTPSSKAAFESDLRRLLGEANRHHSVPQHDAPALQPPPTTANAADQAHLAIKESEPQLNAYLQNNKMNNLGCDQYIVKPQRRHKIKTISIPPFDYG